LLLKLHDDANPSLNTVTAYGDGYIEINQVRYQNALSFGPESAVNVWPAQSAADISSELLMQACSMLPGKQDPLAFLNADDQQLALDPNRPEVLLVGTGSKQIMLSAGILSPLLKAGVGVECMSTAAAARTYNILMAEGRRVIAALILENT
jgi:uncharacterized protein